MLMMIDYLLSVNFLANVQVSVKSFRKSTSVA